MSVRPDVLTARLRPPRWRAAGRLRAWLSGPLAAAVAAVGILAAPPSAHAAEVVFADGFEAGNAWSFWTNGSAGGAEVVGTPVHTGTGALRLTAGANPGQPEIGIVAIRGGLSLVEDQSVLSFWYHASGTAAYKGLSVEAHTATKVHYTLLPDTVVTDQWRQASVRLTDMSPDLAGATVGTLVVKAITDPAAGTAAFTLDDVAVTNGVPVVAQPPRLVTVSPPAGASSVPLDRIPVVTFDQRLEPASVNASTVEVTDGRGKRIDGAVRYLSGQRAIAFVPNRPLLPRTEYTLRAAGVATADGPALEAPVVATFRTGAGQSGSEVAFADDFTAATDWRVWTNAASGASQQHVSAPALAPGGAIRATASDPSAGYVLAQIHDLALRDENSRISFRYHITGTAAPASLAVMLGTRDGRAKEVAVAAGRVVVGSWTSVSVPVAAVSRAFVGQPLSTMELKLVTAGPGEVAFTVDQVRVNSDPAGYAEIPAAEAPDQPRLSRVPAADLRRIADLADHIVSTQNPDGSIPVGPEGDQVLRYVPYFSSFAALGLVRAYELTQRPTYLAAAQKYADWYRAHLRPDGSIHDYHGQWPDLVDTGTADSVDSYASTFLLLLWHLSEAQPAGVPRQSYLRTWYPVAEQVYGSLDSVYKANGLSDAKASYPLQYIQDNSETWFGLQAMARLAGAAGDQVTGRLATALAARTQYAVRQAFVRDSLGDYGTYVTAPTYDVQPSGPLETWYPDALSNVLMLGVLGGGPGQPAGGDGELLRRLVQAFDVEQAGVRPTSTLDTPMYLWWAMAAVATGQPKLARHFVDEYTEVEGPANPATLGFGSAHLIRVLSFPYDGSLWL
ncbi:Ig-like domain-containing protein [Micromonospora sp. NPDC047740]|uniref:Ig-like domain-containing protein n=1 Tax=Micromonospora sp. NPDC047740 TaxID=3364254 RepID=UPI00371692DC